LADRASVHPAATPASICAPSLTQCRKVGDTVCLVDDRADTVELLKMDCFGHNMVLEGSMAGWQQLFLGDTLVSQLVATPDAEQQRVHAFDVTATIPDDPTPRTLHCRLQSTTQWQPFCFDYQFFIDDKLIAEGKRDTKDIEQQVPVHVASKGKSFSLIGLGALGLKLLKSAKLIKALMAGASLAAYTWLFSFQFALALIACLVIHEYGHVRAMRYFGLKTKGIYLIPFFGGAALTDDKINTRWQDVVIAMMGPCFGLLMSLACLLVYAISGWPFFAGLAVFNAFLNLLNLLPILPLDGGHILKSISFSMNKKLGLFVCAVAAALGILVSYSLGLSLFGFLMIIGCLEILIEWRTRHNSHLLPLDRYGQIFSGIWYALLVAGLIGIIWYFGGSGDAVMSLPLKVLQS
jgi:Zn-dependent protease